MAFPDPITVTVNAIAKTLARISSAVNAGTFSKDDGNYVMNVSHQYGKGRTRHFARLTASKIAADPLISAQNIKYSMTSSIILDVPITGYSVAEQVLEVAGFCAWLTASSNANLTKLLGGEN